MKRTDGCLSLWYSYRVMKDGEVVAKKKPTLSRSFVNAYIRLLYLKFVSPTDQSITDTGTTSRSIDAITSCESDAGAGVDTLGLVVGTGSTAVAITDSALQTKIAHGVGASQLSYGASTIALPTSDSTTTSLIHTRVFTNSSGGSITVREIGIYCNMQGSSEWQFLLARDIITQAVADGAALTLNYTYQTTA